MTPQVSVIIPNYNHAKFLKERIESVLNQTYQDFEVIILDDHSTDNSRNIIERYQSNPHISSIVYNDINSGSTFKQWDKGIKIAKGDIIWIAESDDVADKDFLSTLVPLMTNESADIIFSGSFLIDEKSNPINYDPDSNLRRSLAIDKEYFKIDSLQFVKSFMGLGNRMYNASAILFMKKLWYEIPYDFLQMRACGDWLCWINMLIKSRSIIWHSKKLNYFRNHSNKVTPKSIESGLAFEEKKYIIDYLVSLNILGIIMKPVVIGKNYYEIFKSPMSIEKRNYILNLWKTSYSHPKLRILLYLLYTACHKLFIRHKTQ